VHAGRIAERWAAAGIDVRLVTSRAPGAPARTWRDGYQIDRPAGRYGIFPVVGLSHLAAGAARLAAGAVRGTGPDSAPGLRRRPDATVEIWNGMPFFSPLWARGPRVVFLHHVHDRMWDFVLPPRLAAAGRLLECRLAPRLYRHTRIVTLSESSKADIVERLHLDPSMVTVVRPGVDETFCPGPTRSTHPLVVAVGRLVTYKRFDLLVDTLVRLRQKHPDLQAVIAGEGAERPALEAQIADVGAHDWLHLPGRVDEASLLDLYQRAWVLASPSAYEGWGLTVSEAGACATPAVVSPIAGHQDAVADGVSGFLAEPGPAMEEKLDALLGDPRLRRRMQWEARLQASRLSWDQTALDTLRVVVRSAGAARRS
jgi:glycosyltransferase involved in cell wall biosynthesis